VLSSQFREGAQGGANADPGAPRAHGGTPAEISFHYVFVTWTNARVELGVANDTKRGEPGAIAPEPLLTRQQLVTIASDPDLTVTG
jgi:hypothetical protein